MTGQMPELLVCGKGLEASRTCSISQQYLKGMVFIADGGRKTARGNSLQGYFNYTTDWFCCFAAEASALLQRYQTQNRVRS